MFFRKVVGIMIGPSFLENGGIASVVDSYIKIGFLEKNGVLFVPTWKGGGILRVATHYFVSIIYILLLVVTCKLSICHVHMSSRGSYSRKSFLVRLLKLFGIKIVIHLHGSEFQKFYSAESNLAKKNHIAKTFSMADRVIVLSSQWLLWSASVFPSLKNFTVIHNFVAPLDFRCGVRKPGMIVFLGRLGDRKGVADLIYSFKYVNETHPHAVLYLGGDGDVDKYKSLVSNLGLSKSVFFLGWISGADKVRILESADVYCLPSYNEGFPMGVIEAMSIGIPVVSTFAGGIPDAITNGVDGLLVDAGDRESLARALINIIQDRELNDRLSQSGKQKFDACFSQHAIIPKLQAIYDDLLTHYQ